MDNRIKPDFSIRVKYDDESSFLVDRTYDHTHIFPWLGYGLLKLITEEGVAGVPMSQETALRIAETAGIVPTIREEISEREHAQYLKYQDTLLNDDWLH